MMKPAKIKNKILENPRNYAAIYARISSKKDNNSIDAQIIKGKTALNDQNLLLYAVYTDHISGRTTSPPNRPGFGKLLQDAKSGCFKTIIAYKHDRIARNLDDWINLKSELRKLGIKIIFSDGTEYTSDNSLQGDFLENLIMMVAELEPNNINERASNGRNQRRLQGIYNAANNVPFGYERIDTNSKYPSKGKSYYQIEPLKAIFIQYLFCEARDIVGKYNLKIAPVKQKLLNLIDELLRLTSLEDLSHMIIQYADYIKTRLVKEYKKELFLQKIIEALHKYIKKTPLNDIICELKSIRKHLDSTGNLQNILSNSIYGGRMLLKPNEKEKGIIIDGSVPKLNKDSFTEITNISPIIDEKTFSKVYSYMLMPKILKGIEPNFLFKGKLKCGSCNTLLHYKDGLLQCTSQKSDCKVYAKNSVIEAVLEIVVDDALKNSEDGFNNFRNTIKEKINYFEKDLEKLRNEKMSKLKNYLYSKDKIFIKDIEANENNINLILHKIASYSYELSNIDKLQELIEHYNNSIPEVKKSNFIISKIKSLIISHILSNQDVFDSIFDKFIKEVKVNVIEQKDAIKCRFTVNYEFQYDEPSPVPSCIY